MKRILGLDLGTNSIGWALVNEAEHDEKSSIVRTGVRVVPLTTDESTDFEKGKPATVNADRTLKRGARRSLQRFKQRRAHLISLLKKSGMITNETILTETGKNSTHQLWQLRAKAVREEIELTDFARVLLALNKKRGYKSNRKAKDDADGTAVDGMEVAMKLYHENLTPGEYVRALLVEGKKTVPSFYRSDLQNEFDRIWDFQRKFYPELLSQRLKEELIGKNSNQTWAICKGPWSLEGIKLKEKGNELRLEKYRLRTIALSEQVDLERLTIILQEINGQLANASGYLGKISDRSKELHFRNQTVGQYLYEQIKSNPHVRLKNQVFYRQDYLDEFEKIWETQSKNRKDILTNELKEEIRNTVIFYQRKLKSQKGLISICELEGREIILKDEKGNPLIKGDGLPKRKMIGPRVIPKSSPLFQEFKIWQILNNLKFRNTETREIFKISQLDEDMEVRNLIFKELTIKGKLTATHVINEVIGKPKGWELTNYKEVEGNSTISALCKAFNEMVELSGHEVSHSDQMKGIKEVFQGLDIDTGILQFSSDLEGKEFEQQSMFKLWHLLYSYEGDDSKTGNDKLYELLQSKFNIPKDLAAPLANISFKDDYGSLSTRAIKKILPFLKQGHVYSDACTLAGYNHSHYVTAEENKDRKLEDKLELLPKNSLRNPVVEKILNQLVNVINAIIDQYGKPDEIRIELARDLKKSAQERADATSAIARATKNHDRIRGILMTLPPFNAGVRITKNDIIKYKLYEELASNGHKTIYTNTYVPLEKLFSKDFDIEHIIPKAVLFDDSFSNKTLSARDFNLFKSDKTGLDAIAEKYGKDTDGYIKYIARVEKLFKEDAISKAKYTKLLMTSGEIPDGFIQRDLRNTQYISKKAQQLLLRIVRYVTPTTGSITGKLREDWQLVNVLQELNWDKYEKLGMTYHELNKDGDQIPKIQDWTKRNDHRHHAMDAITVAFTKPSHIQYFNYLSARKDDTHKKHGNIIAIEQKETYLNDKKKRFIKPPIPIDEFRKSAKKHLENTLISFKAKNKVATRNQNKTSKKKGENTKIELTPRGQLHKETVYGKSSFHDSKWVKVGTGLNLETISQVAKKSHREALLKRLAEFENDPKKAFGGKNAPSKNPIWLDEHQSEKLPEKVKLVWLETQFTIRKEISPDLKVAKVVDKKAREILQTRLDEFDGDVKKAFSNLEEKPIWLNKDKGLQLKRVTITGISHAKPLHAKKDHYGKELLDEKGNPVPVDFVSPGNNHHVAIYKDENGKLQEDVVSFFEAVARVNANTPIVWHKHPDHPEWKFQFTLKQNEYFVFPNEKAGFDPFETNLMDENNYHLISPHLFRVQKISTKNYLFTHHLETSATSNDDLKKLKQLIGYKYHFVQTPEKLKGIVKVRLNHIGQIIKIGE